MVEGDLPLVRRAPCGPIASREKRFEPSTPCCRGRHARRPGPVDQRARGHRRKSMRETGSVRLVRGRAGRRQLPTQLLRRGARRRTLRHPRLHGCSRCDCSRAPGGGPPVRCHHSAQYAKATQRDLRPKPQDAPVVSTAASSSIPVPLVVLRVLGARSARFGRAWARHAPPPRRRDRPLGRRPSVARRRVRRPHALHLVGGCATP